MRNLLSPVHHASLRTPFRILGYFALLFHLLGHPEAGAGPTGEKLIVETSVETFHIAQALVADFNLRNPGMEAGFAVDRDAIGVGERDLDGNRIHIGIDGGSGPLRDDEHRGAVSLYADRSIHAAAADSKTIARRFVNYVFSRDGWP